MTEGGGVSLRDYVEIQFNDIRELLDERKGAQELAMQTALTAQKEASMLALTAQKEAITKSEIAADQRALTTDGRIQDLTEATNKRIQELTDRVNIGAGTSSGSSKAVASTWAYIFSALMALVGVASVIVLIISRKP